MEVKAEIIGGIDGKKLGKGYQKLSLKVDMDSKDFVKILLSDKVRLVLVFED